MQSGNLKQQHKQIPWDRLIAVAVMAGGLGIGLAWQGLNADDSNVEEAQLLFVQTSDDLVVDREAGTLRLVGVNQQTLYFSDRPIRIAGHIPMANYLEEWTEGDDNFDENPPNASLSVFEPGETQNTVAVVELTNPVVDGDDLVYDYTLIEGTLPAAGGTTALFIDRIGIGGGVGVGFHGVGVGRRGPGVR